MPRWLLVLTAVAVGIGIYARLKGLGVSSFSVDEYYLARSIEDVLRTGLPVFDCGGYYMRGLLQQYSSAGMQLAGVAPELAPRLLAVVSSLISLPAAYLLGRRLHSPVVGLLFVILLALSVWEVEMSRFGRMYAPFQALFLWYAVFFVRVTTDGDTRAAWKMILLSAIAPLVWEGAALLAMANLLALFMLRPSGALQRSDFGLLLAGSALLAASFLFSFIDFRNISGDEFPVGFDTAVVGAGPTVVNLSFSALRSHPLWLLTALLPLVLSAWALRWVWSFRQRPLLMLGLLVCVTGALIHQFLLVASMVVLLLLMRYIRWQELFSRNAVSWHVAIAVALLFWTAYGLLASDLFEAAGGSTVRGMALLAWKMATVPDFIGVVAFPFARVMPELSTGLMVLIGASIWRNARTDRATAERSLLLLLIATVLVACLASPARAETRYLYFAYPAALLVALVSMVELVQRIVRGEVAATATASVLALGGFALSEDFQPSHLRHVDHPSILYRSQMSVAKQAHYEIREDLHSLASWLRQQSGGDTVVINGVHGLDVYFPEIDYYHVDQSDPGMVEWSCKRGSIERWGNYPLLYTTEALAQVARHAQRTLLVTFNYDEPALLQQLAAAAPRVLRRQGHVVVLELGK
jgi:hypothetical protein